MADKWTEEQQKLADRIKDQIEFYFSDSNFRQDKFLRAESGKNDEGFVPLATIATFKRVESLTKDIDFIVAALKSSNSLVLSEDNTQIRRSDPLPEEDNSAARTVYAKRFPLDTTLEELIAFFSQFGKVNCVRMRKAAERKEDGTNSFKGTALVEFAEEEAAKKVVEMKDLRFRAAAVEAKEGEVKTESDLAAPGTENGPLLLQWKADWWSEKHNRNDSKKRKEPPAKKEDPESIIKVSNIGDIDFKQVKELFEKSSRPVAFVELHTDDDGNKNGYVRMMSAEGAETAVKYLQEEKLEFGGKVPELAILRGEEAAAYWEKVNTAAKGAGGGRGRGGRGRGRGRGNKRARKS